MTCRFRRRSRGSSAPASTICPGTRKRSSMPRSVVGKVFWTGRAQREWTRRSSPSSTRLCGKGFSVGRDARRSQARSSSRSRTPLCAMSLTGSFHEPSVRRSTAPSRSGSSPSVATRTTRRCSRYHWRSALELASASGSETSELEERTRLTLAEAGNRAFSLNAFPAAAKYYDDALALWPADGVGAARAPLPTRESPLHRRRRACRASASRRHEMSSSTPVTAQRLRRPKPFLLRATGSAATSMQSSRTSRSAEALIEGADPSPGATRVLAWAARYEFLDGDREGGLRRAEEALATGRAVLAFPISGFTR